MTAQVQAFADRLGQACGLPVALQDERLSSHEAETLLAERDQGLARAEARARRRMRAAVILQDYLDARQPRARADEEHDA